MSRLKIIFGGVLVFLFVLISCKDEQNKTIAIENQLEYASIQIEELLSQAQNNSKIPRSTLSNNQIKWTNKNFDWTEGFFPGTCWYLYESTGDKKWKSAASKIQQQFVDHRYHTTNHDLGFVFNCSYGNGYRITEDSLYKQVMVDAANSLITRFNPAVGCIKSWDIDRGWQSKRGWQFPVIIDNMMNLELLFEVSDLTSDEKYREIAKTHAKTTLENHFRDDFSTFHVVDYDSVSGRVRKKNTAQGYSHESSWARGQAWGLYGYTVCYRYTRDDLYLQTAQRIANYILNHPNLPQDKVPYWDFNAPNIPNELRDVSSAAIIASALLELNTYNGEDFLTPAKEILQSLSSDNYLSPLGENMGFLLQHSVGSIPHGDEIDVPLNYADYYYVEALYRLQKYNPVNNPTTN